jgi:thiol-disulfide isomerase/thioredoxin
MIADDANVAQVGVTVSFMYSVRRSLLPVLAFTISLTATSCGGATASTTTLTQPNVAPALPPLSFATMDKSPLTIGGQSGRITVVDVWASYCKPCRSAFPKLNELAMAHPDISVIGLSVDETDDVVQQFLREVPASITIARDPTLSVKNPPLSMKTLPTLLVLDAAGRIRFRADEASENAYDALPRLIEQLRAEKQ